MEIIKRILSEIGNFLGLHIYKGVTLGTLISIVLGIFISFYILKFIRKWVTRRMPMEDKLKFKGIFKFVNYLVYILVVITVLNSAGINLTVLLTASAALFVGLGFALQYLFQDIISGILIILDQSLHVGDIIEMEGKVARVEDIKLRTTRAITRDDKVLIIPNHKFLTENILNYTQNRRVTRESVKVGVAYGSDTRLVTKLLLEAANEQNGVLRSPQPTVLFDDFGDSALLFILNFFVRDSFGDPTTKSEIRYRIDKKFRENGVTIPFPQRDVHIYKTGGES
ncbi:mechanosensitive ion channel family protein [Robertkochia flava]|uniref:mechanosensitive ion channel family protein n=1 Tax=Robertkochia flava TaxID=3447986 RepID=UPI001CCAA712|nr:mechanosensitive ion channel domain-containing protein [Robertkochia marina]